MIQVPLKLLIPEHADEALNSDIISHWIECLFNCFDKIHNFRTLSCHFPRSNISKGKKNSPTRLSFEIKLTDVLDF